MDQLERWYNIRFIVDDNVPVSHQITVHIRNEPIENIIELIADIMGLKFKQEGDTIYLYWEDDAPPGGAPRLGKEK